MTATIPTVTIGRKTYSVYADIDYADDYLMADPGADAWRALTDQDDKARALVGATRKLNSTAWQGQPTYEVEPGDLVWPRTGVIVNGAAVDPDSIPGPIVDGCCELASQIANGVDISNFVSTIETEKMIKAGPVEIENFRLAASQYPTYPLPQAAWLLIAPYTAGAGGASAGAFSTGTGKRSVLDQPWGFPTGF